MATATTATTATRGPQVDTAVFVAACCYVAWDTEENREEYGEYLEEFKEETKKFKVPLESLNRNMPQAKQVAQLMGMKEAAVSAKKTNLKKNLGWLPDFKRGFGGGGGTSKIDKLNMRFNTVKQRSYNPKTAKPAGEE